MKIFLDNCILSIAQSLQGAVKQKSIHWGDTVQMVEIVGYQRRPLPSYDEGWKREQVLCLPTIGRLAREGKLSLCTYWEVLFEGWKRSGSSSIDEMGNVFAGSTIHHVDAAIERSYFFQTTICEFIETEQVVEFCKWLLTPKIEVLAEKLSGNPRFPVAVLERFAQIQRFRDLCRGLAEKQFPDAFHLWTAEVNGADCFLTIDGRFIRAMTESKNINLPCKLMSPSTLLALLGVTERDPYEHVEGYFYDAFAEASRSGFSN